MARTRPVTWDTAYGFELYMKGCSDNEIAEKVGTKPQNVGFWRRKHWAAAKPMPDENTPPSANITEEKKEQHDIPLDDALLPISQALQRLRAYERTGLTPEKLVLMKQRVQRVGHAVEELQNALREFWEGEY